jgi:hypothetical protein
MINVELETSKTQHNIRKDWERLKGCPPHACFYNSKVAVLRRWEKILPAPAAALRMRRDRTVFLLPWNSCTCLSCIRWKVWWVGGGSQRKKTATRPPSQDSEREA